MKLRFLEQCYKKKKEKCFSFKVSNLIFQQNHLNTLTLSIYIYIYIYIERERDRDRDRKREREEERESIKERVKA